MPLSDQNVNPTRYQIIPRVLVFAFQNEAVLLIKLLPKNGKYTKWTGKFNGPGGHVERGEDLLFTARRELLEETGLVGNLSLCGTIVVDIEQTSGIGLFVYRADNVSGDLLPSTEGIPEWVMFDRLDEYPLVDDVKILLDKIQQMKPGYPPFSGRSFYDENDRLSVSFS